MSQKFRFTLFVGLVLAFSLLTAVVYANDLHRASGLVGYTLPSGVYRTTLLEAVEHEDGSVSGQVLAKNHGDPIRKAQIAVDCLNVPELSPEFPGKLAWISGEIIHTLNPAPNIPDPGYAVFAVVDGDEEAGYGDYISAAYVFSPGIIDCHDFGFPPPQNLRFDLVEEGSVQVR